MYFHPSIDSNTVNKIRNTLLGVVRREWSPSWFSAKSVHWKSFLNGNNISQDVKKYSRSVIQSFRLEFGQKKQLAGTFNPKMPVATYLKENRKGGLQNQKKQEISHSYNGLIRTAKAGTVISKCNNPGSSAQAASPASWVAKAKGTPIQSLLGYGVTSCLKRVSWEAGNGCASVIECLPNMQESSPRSSL